MHDYDGGVVVKPGEAARLLGCSTAALAAWADRGVVRVRRLPSGHRRYFWEDIRRLLGERRKEGR